MNIGIGWRYIVDFCLIDIWDSFPSLLLTTSCHIPVLHVCLRFGYIYIFTTNLGEYPHLFSNRKQYPVPRKRRKKELQQVII